MRQLTTLALALIGTTAQAEIDRTFLCTLERHCDARGHCSAATGDVWITIADTITTAAVDLPDRTIALELTPADPRPAYVGLDAGRPVRLDMDAESFALIYPDGRLTGRCGGPL